LATRHHESKLSGKRCNKEFLHTIVGRTEVKGREKAPEGHAAAKLFALGPRTSRTWSNVLAFGPRTSNPLTQTAPMRPFRYPFSITSFGSGTAFVSQQARGGGGGTWMSFSLMEHALWPKVPVGSSSSSSPNTWES